MSKNIVFEGWLTKSPPTKRIWRTKWRRRWFALRQSGELPGQYFLDYYADPNCKRPKGTINLDLCEQVDAGLHMERTGSGSLDPKLRGSVFTIQTQSRTYHLEADCEADMEKWVDAICRVCGLRSTDEPVDPVEVYQRNRTSNVATLTDHYGLFPGAGPYIPISECTTGYPGQNFAFKPRSIVLNDRVKFHRSRTVNVPHIRIQAVDFSENESNMSEDDSVSLNAWHTNVPAWSVGKSFTRLSVNDYRNGFYEEGPPVPPRPPKTFAKSKIFVPRDNFHGHKFQETVEVHENPYERVGTHLQVPEPTYVMVAHAATAAPSQPASQPTSQPPAQPPSQRPLSPVPGCSTDDDDEHLPVHQASSMQYCNLPSMPPAVDRALKPRLSSHSIGQIHNITVQNPAPVQQHEEKKRDVLQYLDLDLPASNCTAKTLDAAGNLVDLVHGRSLSADEEEPAYKTVDFLKTEAFNSTRHDAEMFRSMQQ